MCLNVSCSLTQGSLAIGITLNLVYHGTKQEAAIQEISGLAYHFKPQFFDELYQTTGVRLENFVYYKGETHYFVMTAVKSSLLARGALLMVGIVLTVLLRGLIIRWKFRAKSDIYIYSLDLTWSSSKHDVHSYTHVKTSQP
jgi:hypothetical protein